MCIRDRVELAKSRFALRLTFHDIHFRTFVIRATLQYILQRKDYLKLRGPGDLFGIRQSGLMDFRIGDVFQDADILKQANEAAGRILGEDPGLESEKNSRLSRHLQQYIDRSILESTL